MGNPCYDAAHVGYVRTKRIKRRCRERKALFFGQDSSAFGATIRTPGRVSQNGEIFYKRNRNQEALF
jgi:hypothetical protein